MRRLFSSLLMLATFASAANGPNDSLAARHDSALATPEGAAYPSPLTYNEKWRLIAVTKFSSTPMMRFFWRASLTLSVQH